MQMLSAQRPLLKGKHSLTDIPNNKPLLADSGFFIFMISIRGD
ncbi:hypothetical protein DFP75_101918 [Marinomonas alcarazii]|uniref:Uncharacterized protein n=1 Tax=Marinomonas alcarazii TaxID=491949 RepID=A0A318V830_9GAMM|nr:hypothetical protein DFP75_101918 [Marinomonas alcarazii]